MISWFLRFLIYRYSDPVHELYRDSNTDTTNNITNDIVDCLFHNCHIFNCVISLPSVLPVNSFRNISVFWIFYTLLLYSKIIE